MVIVIVMRMLAGYRPKAKPLKSQNCVSLQQNECELVVNRQNLCLFSYSNVIMGVLLSTTYASITSTDVCQADGGFIDCDDHPQALVAEAALLFQ